MKVFAAYPIMRAEKRAGVLTVRIGARKYRQRSARSNWPIHGVPKDMLTIDLADVHPELKGLRLDGQTRDRQRLVEAFQADGGPLAFLISLKAGGYGLNLTAADMVVHMDPWWNPAAEAQATDRAHRIGQKNVVNVYRILAKGTIEEKIVELQERKLQLSDRILGGESLQAQGLTREELLELLR